ncbi:MAG: Ig domain-containing protein [Bacteroidota bacterium]|nr:Ig domain-containing protein [Bacteroidota bacterium]|tara:strand:+ start:28172 stop:29800 length:1629 start_codon:yes stop_codon:yes gene_type:complete
MRNLILFFTFSLFLNPTFINAQSNNNDTIISNSQDSLLIKDEIKDVELSFNIINYEINGEQKILIENLFNPTNITLNERDTLSMIIQLKGKEEEVIFNYYFNDNPNFRNIENGKIIYDKRSKRIYFEFIPDDNQAINKFITWNLFAYEKNSNLKRYDFLIEINNLEYAPKIINKQIDKIIRNNYSFRYTPIISDGDNNVLFELKTDAPIDNFNPISGNIDWKIDPNNIDELEKTFSFILKAYKKNKPELFDVDTFKIIYSENNFPPVFGKTSKWIVEEGSSYTYKIPVDDPNVNDSIIIENVGAQLPRGMKLNNSKKTISFNVDYDHVERTNSTTNYNLELKATDLSGLSSQITLDVVVMNTINPLKVQEKITELINELESQQDGLEEINDNLKWIEATSKNNRKIRTFSAAGITFLGALMGVLSSNSEVTRKAGPIIGASGAVLSVINEVLSRDDNEIKNLLQETIKLQSNVKAKYDRLSFYKNSNNPSDFQNQEIDLLVRTIENDRENLNKSLFTISENYKIIISENRIRNMINKKKNYE